MRARKIIVGSLVVIVLVGATWSALLLKTYGLQTLLFLVRSSPTMLWAYTKPLVTPAAPGGTSQLGNLPALETPDQPRASLPPIAAKHYIATMSHMYQKLNNCGPSSVAMAASTLGVNFDQFKAADVLKGTYTDKNVSAPELVSFLQTQGLKAVYRINGNAALMEQFVSRDIPVITEQWLLKRGDGELVGHYRVMRGYDQQTKVFTTNDSFNGPNFMIPYGQFDEWWRPFSRGYVVVYKPEQEATVKMILGPDWDESLNNQGAVRMAEAEVKSKGDGYAYFNLGTAETRFHEYDKAESAYNVALTKTFPPLFLWYQFGPLEAYYQQGEYDRVFSLSDDLLKHAGEMEEARLYRGLSYLKQGKTAEGKAELEKGREDNPRFAPILQALEQVK